jgi:hypothetical protein
VVIPVVDEALTRVLRATLPLPEPIGDVSFDPPSGTWSAQLNRITVNLFLFGVGRSPQQGVGPGIRRDSDGRVTERRLPLPRVQLEYLVSAWAGTIRDEHQLLGDVLTLFHANQVLTAEFLPQPPGATPVQLLVGELTSQRAKDIWSGVSGALKASFHLRVTVAAEAFPWQAAAPPVERIEALTAPYATAPAGRG